jgi:hypothetical protein
LAISARERGKGDDGCEVKEATRFNDAMLQASSFWRRCWWVVGLGCGGWRGRRSGRWAGGARWAGRVSGARRRGRLWLVGCMKMHGCNDRGVIDVNEGRGDRIWGRTGLSERKDKFVKRDMP